MASVPSNEGTKNVQDISDILVKVHYEDPQEVAKKETGRQIAKKIYEQQWTVSGNKNFFSARAAHQRNIELWSYGKQDMLQFMPLMGVSDATKAEVPIDTTPSMVGAFFADTLTEHLSKNTERPVVKAIDDISEEEKLNRYLEAIFRMENVDFISEMQNKYGVQLEPANVYVPDSKLGAQVYYKQKDQLPKEVRFQAILKQSLIDNDYDRVIKPKLIRDNIVFNIEAIKVTKGEGKFDYKLKTGTPRNVFYNFIKTDSGKPDLSYIGEGYNLKAKDIRKKYAKSDKSKNGLTEKEIFTLVEKSTQRNPVSPNTVNYGWADQYNTFTGETPWDDASIFAIEFEIKITESEYWVSKLDNYGNENFVKKKAIPQIESDKSELIKRDNECVYTCVYCPDANMVLFWGKTGDTFSWFINIPHNNGEYVPSLFERAIEMLNEYQLLKLKKKLLIGRLSPNVFNVDVENIRNVSIGGKNYGWEDIVRIRLITGANLWSSRGLDPLEKNNNPAITAAMQDPTLQQIIELDNTEKSIIQSIREILGLPIYLDGSSVGQRTSGRMAEGQRESSSNVSGFITNSHNQLMEEALNYICHLAWKDVVTSEPESEEDLVNTKFKVQVKMDMTQDEKERLEIDIDRWSKTPDENGKPLLSPADAFAIRQIDDITLAEMYLADKVQENERKAAAEKQKREEFTARIQKESNEQATQNAMALQDEKLSADKEMLEFTSNNKKQEILLDKGLELFKVLLTPQKSSENNTAPQKPQLPPELNMLLSQTFQSISATLYKDQKVMEQQEMDEQQEAMEEQMAAEQEQEQMQSQPQMPQ